MAPKKPVIYNKPETTKQIERPISKGKRSKKKNYQSFSIYVYKVLKSLNNDCGISSHTMMIMNSFIADMLQRIAVEAGMLISHGKKSTLSTRDVQAAVKLLVPGELWKHANAQGLKAVKTYIDNKAIEADD